MDIVIKGRTNHPGEILASQFLLQDAASRAVPYAELSFARSPRGRVISLAEKSRSIPRSDLERVVKSMDDVARIASDLGGRLAVKSSSSEGTFVYIAGQGLFKGSIRQNYGTVYEIRIP